MHPAYGIIKLREKEPEPTKWKDKIEHRISQVYVQHKIPIEVQPQVWTGTEGYEFTIPFTREVYEKLPENKQQKCIEKINSLFEEKNVKIVYMQSGMNKGSLNQNVVLADVGLPTKIYITTILQKILKITDLNWKNVNIAIIDGEDNSTEYVIDYIYKEVNYLSLITHRLDHFENTINHIYEDVGLNVVLYDKKELTKLDADIIINLSKEDDKLYYTFKRGAVYIDFISDMQYKYNLLCKRRDLLMIDGLLLKWKETPLDLHLFSMLLYTNFRIIRRLYTLGFKPDMKKEIQDVAAENDIQILSFLAMGNKIEFPELERWKTMSY